jgi:hypothetical protein
MSDRTIAIEEEMIESPFIRKFVCSRPPPSFSQVKGSVGDWASHGTPTHSMQTHSMQKHSMQKHCAAVVTQRRFGRRDVRNAIARRGFMDGILIS